MKENYEDALADLLGISREFEWYRMLRLLPPSESQASYNTSMIKDEP